MKSKLSSRMRELANKFISVQEAWFDEEPEPVNDVDILYYRQWTTPITGMECKEFHSFILDLTKAQDQLWEGIGKNTRYKIKRATEKDQIVYEIWDMHSLPVLYQFCDFYDEFATQKGLSRLNRTRLISFMNTGKLDISQSKSPDGVPLVWHTYYRSKTHSFLLYSASMFRNSTDTAHRNMVGRANRYHHWQDIVRFKNLGVSVYDFGGWYIGNTDAEKLRINQFKEEFGGEITKNFNCKSGITLKGNLFLTLRNLLLKNE